MQLHAFQRLDGDLHLFAVRMHAAGIVPPEAHSLGTIDMDLRSLSPAIALGVGREAGAVARDDDAMVVRLALVAQGVLVED